MHHPLMIFLCASMCIFSQCPVEGTAGQPRSSACETRKAAKEALLQTTISAIPQNTPRSAQEHIQPGTWMRLQAVVQNVGTTASEAGKVRIQFAFPNPLDKQKNSVIFETESLNLPSIEPGEQVLLQFEKNHRWPSLFHFIRDDWAVREYQAVATINCQVRVIGALTIAFSAYYYQGARLDKPVGVPSTLQIF